MYHGANALFIILEDKIFKKKFLFITSHIPYNVKRGQLKLACLTLIFKAIENIKNENQFDDIIFAGDFNMIPNSMLYEYLTQNNLNLEASLNEYSN